MSQKDTFQMLLRYTFKLYEAIAVKFKLNGYRKDCKNMKGQKHLVSAMDQSERTLLDESCPNVSQNVSTWTDPHTDLLQFRLRL